VTVNNSWSIELGKAETAAVATTRWTGLLRTLGYTVFIVYVVLGVLALLAGVVTLFSDGASTGLPLIGGGLLVALLGAIIAAPLLAISSYLAMGAHKSLAEVAHLEQTGRPLNAVGLAPATAVIAPAATPAAPVVQAPEVTAAPAPAPAPPAPPAPAAVPAAAPAPPAPAPAPAPPAPPAPTAAAPAPAPPAPTAAAPAPPAPAPAPPAPPAPPAASPQPTIPPTGAPRPGDAPGFYDDPDDPSKVRYWGGSMWTETRMPRP
jgi:hypothetical protein